MPDETERDTNLERLDNGEDMNFGSENRIESILSPTAEVFVPKKASETKIVFGTEEVNSLEKSGENYCDDYSNCDASGLRNTASGQTEMGAREKTSLTDQEINNGRSEVESRSSSSGIDKRINVPANNSKATQVVLAKRKRGRPRKGSRVPERRSDRVR